MKRKPETYYVLFVLQGTTEDQVHRVDGETYDRLRLVVFSGGDREDYFPFLYFSTLDGWDVAISLSDIQEAQFSWEPLGAYLEQPEVERVERGEGASFLLRGHEKPKTEGIGDARDIYEFFRSLESGGLEENEFLSFEDEDGDTVAINVGQLVWFRASTEVVEDGRKEVMAPAGAPNKCWAPTWGPLEDLEDRK